LPYEIIVSDDGSMDVRRDAGRFYRAFKRACVALLEIPPVESPPTAVKAAIVSGSKRANRSIDNQALGNVQCL
jgi:hypothetical protein